MDVTVGSALDLFGGNEITYSELLVWNREHVESLVRDHRLA